MFPPLRSSEHQWYLYTTTPTHFLGENDITVLQWPAMSLDLWCWWVTSTAWHFPQTQQVFQAVLTEEWAVIPQDNIQSVSMRITDTWEIHGALGSFCTLFLSLVKSRWSLKVNKKNIICWNFDMTQSTQSANPKFAFFYHLKCTKVRVKNVSPNFLQASSPPCGITVKLHFQLVILWYLYELHTIAGKQGNLKPWMSAVDWSRRQSRLKHHLIHRKHRSTMTVLTVQEDLCVTNIRRASTCLHRKFCLSEKPHYQ